VLYFLIHFKALELYMLTANCKVHLRCFPLNIVC